MQDNNESYAEKYQYAVTENMLKQHYCNRLLNICYNVRSEKL